MSDETPPPKPKRDWSDIEIPSIPEDDPIYTEGLIITFPIRPPRPETDEETPRPPEARKA